MAAEMMFGAYVDGCQIYDDIKHSELVDPSTGRSWATCSAPENAIALALASANAAVDRSPLNHERLSARAKALMTLASLIEREADSFARYEMLAAGKTLKTTYQEVKRTAEIYRYFAGGADKVDGLSIEISESLAADVSYAPLGVVCAIVPFNGALGLGTWKIAPALATCNSVVVKPPMEAPASCLLVARLAIEAGLPPGALNVVPGGADVGRALVCDDRVDLVTFTGSTPVAKQIGALVSGRLRKFSCEAGGKSANIIFADADLEEALAGVRNGIFGNAGQSCVAGSRILIERPIYDRFLKEFKRRALELRIGDPSLPDTDIGPLASASQLKKVSNAVTNAIAQGAKLEVGQCISNPLSSDVKDGFFYPPTVLSEVKREMEIWREETFGPVAIVVPFDDESEAVTLANDSVYGLAAGVWTQDMGRARRMKSSLQAGTIWINTYRTMHHRVPFGGVKDSGIGRENGFQALKEFVEAKSSFTAYSPLATAFKRAG